MPLALRLALRPRPRPLPALSLTVLSLASCEARPSRPGVAWVRRASSSSSSSSRWKQRQGRDKYARDAKVHGLKSRAAFKLLEVLPPPWSGAPLRARTDFCHVLGGPGEGG